MEPANEHSSEVETRMLAEVVRRTRNGAVVTDAEGRIVWVNEGFVRVAGYTLEELRGKKPGHVLGGPDTDRSESRRMSQAIRLGQPCVAELVNYAKNGRRYIVRVEIEPLRDDDGAVTGFMAIETDVTDQRRMEAELCESEARFRSLVNNLPGTAFRVRPDGTNEFVSDGIERVTGYPASDFMVPAGGTPKRDCASVTHPDDVALVDAAFTQALTSRSGYAIEYRVLHRNGETRWVAEHGQVLCDPRSGEPRYVDGVQFDITDRKRAEATLIATTAALEEAQTVGKLGSWVYDVATARVVWSRQIFRIFGRDEALGVPSLEEAIALYAPADAARLGEHFTRALATGEQYTLVLRTAPGCTGARYVRAECRARRDAAGTIVALYGTAADVTDEVEREEALREARCRAEAANESKSQFLANMSHEIRTPMTAILGYADLLAESEADGPRGHRTPAERLECIETIRRNGEHLLAIINDILDVSKIEAGRMTVEAVSTQPATVVENVVRLMEGKAAAKGISLRSSSLTPLPDAIISDPVRLRQILVNLVGNAIKFTAHGGVELRVSHDPCTERLTIEVTDTGIGLEPHQLDGLFDAFVQADSSITRRFGGTGLGLRISKSLAQMLGGDITVTSEAGRGSTFTVTIRAPLALRALRRPAIGGAPPPSASGDRPLEGVRVLLAEDGPDNQRLIAFHLKRAGAVMHVVEHGRFAVEALTVDGTLEGPLREPLPFDLILSDMQMPVMDGYAATRLLRAKGCTLPIIALTAHAMSGDRERCIAAGCDEYATKPIDRESLVKACVAAVRLADRAATDRAAA